MRLIIDTDPGIDDALALLYAVASPEARIEAITTVAGNVDIVKTTRNAHHILRHAALPHPPPIFQGCATPLHRQPVYAEHVHGEDGLAGQYDGLPYTTEHGAVEAILRIARQNPGEISLLALGPLTNVAAALQADPSGFANLKQVVIMGGAIEPPGNITPLAEFNFHADPHAARQVLRSPVPLTLVPLDLTRKAVLHKETLRAWTADRTDSRARFVTALCHRYFHFYSAMHGGEFCFLHDPLATAIALDPALARIETLRVEIETEGEMAAGMVVRDLRPHRETGCIVNVASDCSMEEFFHRFEERVVRPRGADSAESYPAMTQ
ncbi:MAG: nucleoside hydrolase [Acidobacteria bacterium]|nr:nucleoside hydrolase [Acidobacteriota bacterium]